MKIKNFVCFTERDKEWVKDNINITENVEIWTAGDVLEGVPLVKGGEWTVVGSTGPLHADIVQMIRPIAKEIVFVVLEVHQPLLFLKSECGPKTNS